MDKFFGCNLEFVREDDYVEYFVFPQLPAHFEVDGERTAKQLEELHLHMAMWLEQCQAVVQRLIEERHYIWHKDEFQLQIRTGHAQECLLIDEGDAAAAALPPHLHGVTHYGDDVADEWFIVFLLSELTRELTGSIVRVVDADGEFLMIECADVLPQWANPDTCDQRVYIADGGLQLVQNSPSNTAATMPVATAIVKIRQNPTLYRVSKEIQQCIEARLQEFRTSPPHNLALHHQIVHLPLGVAALLKKRPALIAPAVRAFCDRDPIDLKACRTMRYFPPEQRVRTNVRFTRCLYAMVSHSNYVPDRKIGWNLSGPTNTEQYKEDLLGVKIASGFEILASQAKSADDDNVKAANDPAWRAYVRSLTGRGYFRDNLEGSAEHKRLLGEAESYFKRNNERFRAAPLVGREIMELLHSTEINAEQLRDEENNLQPSDSDAWLHISADQLDEMLTKRYGPKKLYTATGDLNAAEFTQNLVDFLDKQSDLDGIEHVDSDDDDLEDEEQQQQSSHKQRTAAAGVQTSDASKRVKKNQSMRKACRERPMAGAADPDTDDGTTHVRNFLDFVIPEDNWDSNSEMSDYEDEADLERNFETMAMGNPSVNVDADIRAYMAQMDKELAATTIGQTFVANGSGRNGNTKTATAADDDFDDIEAFEPININVNTLKNMMDSYKSQLGGAGPVSNLLSAMGVGMSAAATDALNEEAKDLSESTV